MDKGAATAEGGTPAPRGEIDIRGLALATVNLPLSFHSTVSEI